MSVGCDGRYVIRNANLTLIPFVSFPAVSVSECTLPCSLSRISPILLLDEPITYLDIEYQLSRMELLHKLEAQGKTIIMVLHGLEQALRYSDRIITIDAGRKTFTGTPEEILNNGTLKKVFHVDVQRSDYRFELKKPRCVSSEAVITVFGSSSCRSR